MKFTCTSCEALIREAVAFCPSCERPTRYATPEQLREFEISQWRKHQSGPPAPATQVIAKPAAREPVPHRPASKAKTKRVPKVRVKREAPLPRTHEVDPSNPFHFTACPSCEKTDWLLRTGRNEDDTWRYWCVRCSRSFKTDALIAHGRMPFIAAGAIVAALLILATIL